MCTRLCDADVLVYVCVVQGGICISPGRTSRGTRNIINQHLRTIRVLEERLAAKESSVKGKDEALKEATEDLVRDERIFAEKVEAHLPNLILEPIWSFFLLRNVADAVVSLSCKLCFIILEVPN